MNNIGIHDIQAREEVGRETIKRFHAQFRAASLEVVKILENNNVDMVYCDYHDDFVVREKFDKEYKYNFYQVKTKSKKNHLWSISDIFGLYTRRKKVDAEKIEIEKIKDSFVCKMLLHTVNFKSSCSSITFLTNINIHDHVENINDDIDKELFENKFTLLLIEKFNECFLPKGKVILEDEIKEHLKKLCFDTNNVYLLEDNAEDFYEKIRTKILKYSEIDLHYLESKEITDSLIALIEKKSRVRISDLSKEELDDACGINLKDILEILSISQNVYNELLKGGDEQAIKNASILQRTLSVASPEILEFCSKVKTDWDTWLRTNRHIIPPFELNKILTKLDRAVSNSSELNTISFEKLLEEIEELHKTIKIKVITNELLLGGALSTLVRRLSQ